MSRPKKYRRNAHLFQLPKNTVKGDTVVMDPNTLCAECRKPLTKKQIARGFKCCSYKCSNRRKGRQFKGKPVKRLHVMNDYL